MRVPGGRRVTRPRGAAGAAAAPERGRPRAAGTARGTFAAMDELVFGTDGWRALVGEGFTHANVARAARAYAAHLRCAGGGLVLVAHDTRFAGARFARVAAAALAEEGLEVRLHEGPLPTPVLSFAVRQLGAAGGVMLTASHNPSEYQGFKIKGPYGGTALDPIYRDVAARLAPPGREPPAAAAAHALATFEVREAYYRHLAGLVDLDALRRASGRVVHDAMGGAAGGWFAGFLRWAGARVEVDELRATPDPNFDGVAPEPLPANLGRTRAHLRARPGARFALVTDGDGDRLAAVLPDGAFFDPHQTFALLLDLLDRRGGPGIVVETFTVAQIVGRLADARGRERLVTPVGFKHLVEPLRSGRALIAGEESGGIGVRGHVPERDGILNGLLLLEAEETAGASLADRFAALEAEAGWRHGYQRADLHLRGRDEAARVNEALAVDPELFGGARVTGVERIDGVKLAIEGGASVMFRASGTEPLLRVYVEASAAARRAELVAAAEAFVAAAGGRGGAPGAARGQTSR